MVARNGDTVELRHVLGCIRKDITDNTHGRSWRVNIGITYHELFQDIILIVPAITFLSTPCSSPARM